MIVDVHAHYYPRPYMAAINRLDVPSPLAAPLGTQSIADRLALMDGLNIQKQILSVSQAQPYLDLDTSAVSAARLGNDLYEELCLEYPERFSYFAVLPLPHVEASLAEIRRVANSPHVVGFTIGCSIRGIQLDDQLLDPIYAELNRRGMTLFLHPVGQTDVEFLKGHNLPWSIGATFEDTAAALRLVYADIPGRFADLKIIVPHLGGTLPFLMARLIRKGSDDTLRALRSFYYDTVSGSLDALNSTCHVFGADKILFGTDYPFCDEHDFTNHLRYLDRSEIAAEELDAVRGETARRLLEL